MSLARHPTTRDDWQALAASLSVETRAYIDGAFVEAQGGAILTTTNPATGEV
ncbi:aldehyde dehydrogenase PuuC, partial [Halomonas nitroreducens]